MGLRLDGNLHGSISTLSFLKDQFVVRSSGGNLLNTQTTRPEDNEEAAESDIEKLPLTENESSVVAPAQTKRKRRETDE